MKPSTLQQIHQEFLPPTTSEKNLRVNKGFLMWLGKRAVPMLSLLPTAAIAALPAADFWGGADASIVKTYSLAQENLKTNSHIANVAIDNSVSGSVAFGESLAMGFALTKSKRLKGAYKAMDDRYEEKRNNRSRLMRGAVTVAKSPLTALEKIGNGVEWAGNKISSRRSKVIREVGKFAIDLGQTTAITSTGVIANEVFDDKTPSDKRTLWLSGLGSGAILGLIEGARKINQSVPFLRAPMNAIAHGFDLATSVDFTQPWHTPIGSGAISFAAVGLAYTGLDIARAHREHVEAQNVQQVINGIANSEA